MLQNKNYSKKKYQLAGETNYGIETMKFFNDFRDSKQGQRMLKKSTKSEIDYKNHYNNRKKNINETQFSEYNPETFIQDMGKSNAPFADSNDVDGFARIYKKDTSIHPKVYVNQNSKNKATTYLHEGSHAEDYGGLNIPEKDVTLLNKIFRKNNTLKKSRGAFNDWYSGDANENSKYTYVAEPTETRARINEVRKQMMDSNIRNVFDKKIRVKDLKNYNGSWNTYNLYKTEDADGSNFNMKPNPLQEIIEGYQLNNSNKSKPNRKDWKQVKKMFNTISDNSNNNYNNYAKYGGEITFKNYSKFNK